MAHVVVFTDFDGTLTGRAGVLTIRSPFYQSLLTFPGIKYYKDSPLIPPEEVKNAFIQKFGPYNEHFNFNQTDADILINLPAVNFLKYALHNPAAKIHIITKNKKAYVHAVMTYQGFTPEELSRVEVDGTGFKYEAVDFYLAPMYKKKPHPGSIYILDDDANDLNAMDEAIKPEYRYISEIHKIHHNPGQFQWANYQDELHRELSALPPSAEKKVPESQSADTLSATTEASGVTNASLASETPETPNQNNDKAAERLQQSPHYQIFIQGINVLTKKMQEFQEESEEYKATRRLYDHLKQEADTFFDKAPSEALYQSFKKQCKKHINEERPILERHRGWAKLLANILAIILSAGIGYAVVAGIDMARHKGRLTLFKTDSAINIDAVEDLVDDKDQMIPPSSNKI